LSTAPWLAGRPIAEGVIMSNISSAARFGLGIAVVCGFAALSSGCASGISGWSGGHAAAPVTGYAAGSTGYVGKTADTGAGQQEASTYAAGSTGYIVKPAAPRTPEEIAAAEAGQRQVNYAAGSTGFVSKPDR
jgi:hypothetical protein